MIMGIKERLLSTYETRSIHFKRENNTLKEFINGMEEHRLCDSEFNKLFSDNDFICIIHNRVYYREVVDNFTDNLLYSCFIIELFNSVVYTDSNEESDYCIIKNIYRFNRNPIIRYQLNNKRHIFYWKSLLVISNMFYNSHIPTYNLMVNELTKLHEKVESALSQFGYNLVPGITVNKLLKYVELHIRENIQVDIENNGIVNGTVMCNSLDSSYFSPRPVKLYYSYNTNKIIGNNDIRLHKYNENLDVLKELSEWDSLLE